ncbi:PLDc N-terminal domain-containing protein [Desulfocurvus sp. DL9XJH121]
MQILADLPPWFLVVLAVTIICLGISFWGIWHAYWREFPTVQEKMIWLVVIVFIPFAGGIAYLGWGRTRARKTT